MKSIIYLMIMGLSFSSLAHALTLDELAGIYKAVPKTQLAYLDDGISIEYKIAISKSHDEFGHNIVGINEYIMKKLEDGTRIKIAEVKCQGTAELTSDLLLTSNVSCENNSQFEQKINLADVKDPQAKTFEASVFSSLYGSEIMMQFTRTQIISKKK